MLDSLGIKHGTDKSSLHHNYCGIYESYFETWRNEKISLIECGVGGYKYADRGGESLRMWYEYFPFAKIIGVDMYPKENIINNRTEFWQGSQTDAHLLSSIIEREKDAACRMFIDDASHNNKLTIKTFEIVFPLLSTGDFYIAEDVHTSYWGINKEGVNEYEGCEFPGEIHTSMYYFSQLTHQLNHETLLPEFKNEFAGLIEFIHFYKEIVVVKKK